MEYIIHCGDSPVGGMAAEIRTASTRILIDMSADVRLEPDFHPEIMHTLGVNDSSAPNAVFFAQNYGDHVSHIENIRIETKIFMGALAREIMLKTLQNTEPETVQKAEEATLLVSGEKVTVGDITVTPYAFGPIGRETYQFLIEADGRRVLCTGDVKPNAVPAVGHVDALIVKGGVHTACPERKPLADFTSRYKYVFVMAPSSNLKLIASLADEAPDGRLYCDAYQKTLLDLVRENGCCACMSACPELTVYDPEAIDALRESGFVMLVRDNVAFRNIVSAFDPKESVILYTLCDCCRKAPTSTIPSFLSLAGTWAPFPVCRGGSSPEALTALIGETTPGTVIPLCRGKADSLKEALPGQVILAAESEKAYSI